MSSLDKALQTQLNNIQSKTGKSPDKLAALVKKSGMYNYKVKLTDAGAVDDELIARAWQAYDSAGKPMSPTRPRYEMPDFMREALTARGLMGAYQARPPYQQNDYIGWITRAKQPATREKRLAQMLDELADGDKYMKMAYHPR